MQGNNRETVTMQGTNKLIEAEIEKIKNEQDRKIIRNIYRKYGFAGLVTLRRLVKAMQKEGFICAED